MTREEQRWFSRLRRTLKDMPETVEIQVHQSTIQMNKVGGREEYFLEKGHADGVESLDEFRTERVYPCSESI